MNSSFIPNTKIILTFFCLTGFYLTAQDIDLHSEVKKLFKDEESIWYSYYTGSDQDLNKVTMVSAHNQAEIKGYINIQNKNNLLRFESAYPNKKGSYLVIQSSEEVWGNLSMIENDSSCIGKLLSRNKNSALQINLRKTSRFRMLPSDCPSQLNYYSFSNDSLGIYFILQSYTDRKVNGYFSSIHNNLNYYLKGECMNADCQSFQLFATDLSSGVKNKINISLMNNKLLGSDNHIIFSDLQYLKADQGFGYFCKSIQTKYNQVGVYFPNLLQKEYQKWQQDYSNNWILDHSHIQEQLVDSGTNLNLHFEISTLNPYFISGNYYWTEPGYNKIVNYPFNYNLKSGEIINLQEIFEKNTDYKSVLTSLIDSTKKTIFTKEQDRIKKFIFEDPFNYWNLLPNGICFYSEFHSIYGRFKILIPYRSLDLHLRKNSIIKKFIQHAGTNSIK